MEQRLARLEDWRQSVEGTLAKLETKIDKIGEAVQRIEVAMARSPVCSAPNLCIDLKKALDKEKLGVEQEIAEVKNEVLTVEAELNKARGGLRVLLVVLTICSSLFATLLTLFVNHVSKRVP